MKSKKRRFLRTLRDGLRFSPSLFLLAVCLLGFSFSAGAKGYRSTLKEWTRSKQLYSTQDMQVKILTHATFFSPEFRGAFIEEHMKRKYLEGSKAAQYLEKHEQRDARGLEFFIGIYTPKDYRELSLGEESFWEAVLTTEGGEELKPISIELREVTPYTKVMFPYLSRWSKAYLVVFPKTDPGSSFQLTLRSVVGESHLIWK